MRGANTYTADQNNLALGGGGLDFGQILGSVLGLNNYGSLSGNQTYVNRDGVPGRPGVAVTEGGMYDNGFLGGGPFGLFSDPRTADTFQESVDRHNITKAAAALALYNAKNGYTTGGTGNNGSQTGMGGNGFSGNLSAGAGNAVSAGGTGGLQNGFGGGGY
jgi:hypothetical protein